MSKEYILFDKNAYSGRVVLFHRDVLCNSGIACEKKLFEKEEDGNKVLQGVKALENTIFSRVFSEPLVEEICWGSDESDNGREDWEDIDALLNLDDEDSCTKDFSGRAKVRESFKRLRDEIGGEGDAVEVIQEAITCVKKLHLELLSKLQDM